MKKENKEGKKAAAKRKQKYDVGYSKRFVDAAVSIGFTRKEAIGLLHEQGYYLTKRR